MTPLGPDKLPELTSHLKSVTQPKHAQPPKPGSKHTEPLGPPSDQIELSPETTERQRIQEAVSRLPDVREERIERLRQALDSGQYHIESEQIADALIRDTFLNIPPA